MLGTQKNKIGSFNYFSYFCIRKDTEMYTVKDIHGKIITTIEDESIFAVFRDLDLRNADFNGAKLRYAMFIRCNVDGADFRGADMLAANIEQTDFTTAITDRTTLFPVEEEQRPHYM